MNVQRMTDNQLITELYRLQNKREKTPIDIKNESKIQQEMQTRKIEGQRVYG